MARGRRGEATQRVERRLRALVGDTRVRLTYLTASSVAVPRLEPHTSSRERDLPVHCVVFSKDRAMQLDACLRSLERNAPYLGEIAVIYATSDAAFDEGYRLLEPSPRVRLVRERDFQADVLEELSRAGEHVVFHTDDDVFFRRPPAAPVVPDGVAAFSLRLGRNVSWWYPYDRPQQPPRAAVHGDVLAWDWRTATGYFAYPLSLNGHVFRTDLVRRILRRPRFRGPNELEAELNNRRYLAPGGMLSFLESSLVSIPANLVNTAMANRASASPATSAESLNRRFLAGERIDFEQMDFSVVDAAHCEVAYAFGSPER